MKPAALGACALLLSPVLVRAADVSRPGAGAPLAVPAAQAPMLAAPRLPGGQIGAGLTLSATPPLPHLPPPAQNPALAAAQANQELLAGAKAGDVSRMQAALAAGAALNHSDFGSMGQTAILAAAAAGHADAVRFLSAKGADRNARDSFRMTPLIYAAMRGDLALLESLGSPQGLDLLALDAGGRSAFDHARSGGHVEFESRLRGGLDSVDLRADPEHYLVVNFVGLGGGGRLEARDLESDPRVAHVLTLRRNRSDQKEARETIARWMETDISRGGPRAQNLVIVGSSWGSAPAASLARWFEKAYGFPARLHVFIEGANLLGLPNRAMGPASERKDYHIEGWHWPHGGASRRADENVSLGDTDHDSGLFVGAARAVEDIQALLARRVTRTGAALRDLIWTQRILPSAYGELPTSNGGWRNALKGLRTFFTFGKTFDSEGDELPKSRGRFKLLHPFGSVLKVRYRGLPGHPFTGLPAEQNVEGLARLSLGAPEAGGSFIPGTALKFFIDGNPSANAVFLGERTGVDGQQPDKNFFAQTFTNDLPKPQTRATKIAAFILGLFNHGNALRIPVDQFALRRANGAVVAQPKAPYRLLLKPAPGRGNPSDTTREFREELADLGTGPLFEVYAAESADGPLIHVGDIEAESQPVASEYGDKGLFFRHRRVGSTR